MRNSDPGNLPDFSQEDWFERIGQPRSEQNFSKPRKPDQEKNEDEPGPSNQSFNSFTEGFYSVDGANRRSSFENDPMVLFYFLYVKKRLK